MTSDISEQIFEQFSTSVLIYWNPCERWQQGGQDVLPLTAAPHRRSSVGREGAGPEKNERHDRLFLVDWQKSAVFTSNAGFGNGIRREISSLRRSGNASQ